MSKRKLRPRWPLLIGEQLLWLPIIPVFNDELFARIKHQ